MTRIDPKDPDLAGMHIKSSQQIKEMTSEDRIAWLVKIRDVRRLHNRELGYIKIQIELIEAIESEHPEHGWKYQKPNNPIPSERKKRGRPRKRAVISLEQLTYKED